MSDKPRTKVTAPSIKERKGGQKIGMVTAYDTPGAVIASEAGADIILVGDSVANTVLGFDTTLVGGCRHHDSPHRGRKTRQAAFADRW